MEEGELWASGDNIRKMECDVKNFSVNIKSSLMDKLYGWTCAADSEISGLGLVKLENDVFNVYDAFLLPQTSTSAHTEIDAAAVAKLMADLNKKKVPLSHLKLWWHTHYNFACFWSQTDVETCEKICGSAKDWSLAIVLNQKYQYKCRVDVYKPVRLAVDDLMLNVYRSISPDKKKQYKKDVEKHVKVDNWISSPVHTAYPAWPAEPAENKGYRSSVPERFTKWKEGKYGKKSKAERRLNQQWENDAVHTGYFPKTGAGEVTYD